jgi:hypothetical protein
MRVFNMTTSVMKCVGKLSDCLHSKLRGMKVYKILYECYMHTLKTGSLLFV